jgi:hypothetical protein
MKTYLWLGTLCLLCTVASGEILVDGDLGDWDAPYIFVDPGSDNSGGVEMTRWGARIDGEYLYWFCEISQDWTDLQGQASNGKDKKIFPGLWIDADNSTGTFLSDDDCLNCADADKGEWASNHRGIDVNLELGLVGSWTNGNNVAPDGEGPGGSIYNYWGLNDDVAEIEDGVSDGSWISSGNVMEARVLLSEIEAILLGMSDGVVSGDTWLLAVGVQGTNRSDIGYGYDVGTPRAISIPASEAPEPATMSLLGMGVVMLVSRRRK